MPQQPNFVNVLVIKNFSNYFDRKIFYYDTPLEYRLTALSLGLGYHNYGSINFNPADGVDTTLVLNSKLDNSTFELLEANYLVVHTGEITNTVISRWYIMDVNRNAEGIYTLTLRRDVVAEVLGKKPSWEAPIYVMKGMLKETDPLIVNDENLPLNQIKTEEILLNNNGQEWGYIIGYFDNSVGAENISAPYSTGESTDYYTLAQVAERTGIPETSLTKMLTDGSFEEFATNNDMSIRAGIDQGESLGQPESSRFTFSFPGCIYGEAEDYTAAADSVFIDHAYWKNYAAIIQDPDEDVSLKTIAQAGINFLLGASVSDMKDDFSLILQNHYSDANRVFLNQENYDELVAVLAEGKPIKIGADYFTLSLATKTIVEVKDIEITKGLTDTFDDLVSAMIATYPDYLTENSDWIMLLNYTYKQVYFNKSVAEIPGVSGPVAVQIPSTRNKLLDAPYDMFAIPYGSIAHTTSGDEAITGSFETSLRLASAIALHLGDKLYDLQLLPYAPPIVRKFLMETPLGIVVDIESMTKHVDYEEVTFDGNLAGFIFFESKSKQHFNINQELRRQRDSLKIESQTDFYRIVSPNYSSSFDFNLAKNGGFTSVFYVDITYKPYNPFIKISPVFDFLYGINYNDMRGLICSGDFSIPTMSSAWTNYENNNKLYSQIFARDIQNLDVKQDLERFKEPFSVVSGTAVGAGAGALGGAKIGGGYGAIAGAAIGATTGLAGGIMDMGVNEKLRQEDRRYALDKYNLSLANIKAMPLSLTKSGVLSQAFRVVPIIERYTCTDEEVAALENKIKYEGMTVNRIDFAGNYINDNGFKRNRTTFNYFKGELIHAVDIEEDNHFADTLYSEFAKGVYI